jgi:hypothetical protein
VSHLDSKLVERFDAAIEAEDTKAKDMLTEGNLKDIASIQNWYGYRRALRDAKKLLSEAYEDLMKE